MKRVLLTGATGFVGANLCRRLLEEGHEVHCLVRNGFAVWRIEGIRQHLHLHEVDLEDETQLDSIISKLRPEWIFHLATHGAYSWQTDLGTMIRTNLLSTVSLIEACMKTGFEILVNTGSSSEYGYKDHAPAETEWIDPNSYYAVTKAAATLFCRYAAVSHGACIPTLRLYSVYGPYEDPGRLIPAIILHGLQGSLPPLADPDTARDYIYVRDVADAYLLLAERALGKGGEVYNLGSGTQTTLAEVVDLACDVFNLADEPHWGTMARRPWDTTSWTANIESIRALGWEPEVTFEQGFRQTVDWFRNHPELIGYYRKEQRPTDG